jgi:quercetin dioxygenase-like cupin family protein
LKSINSNERKVVNIKTATFTQYDKEATGETGTSYIKLNPDMDRDIGFYIYKMEPGASSTPHRHGGAEEFYVIEGELKDNDGTIYSAGDVVWLAPGTEHTSYSENGCTVAVFSQGPEETPT